MNSIINCINSSGMSNAEFYRLNGTMTDERIETLLGAEAAAADRGSVVSDLDEVKAGFPDEDCASALIDRMQQLAKRLRGDNRTELLALVDGLLTLQTSLANNAECGCEKLKDAIRALDTSVAEAPITQKTRAAS